MTYTTMRRALAAVCALAALGAAAIFARSRGVKGEEMP